MSLITMLRTVVGGISRVDEVENIDALLDCGERHHVVILHQHVCTAEETEKRMAFFADLKSKYGREVIGVFDAEGKEVVKA